MLVAGTVHCLFRAVNPVSILSGQSSTAATAYRGRLAPSPTGYLHLGHARTFWVAQERARAGGGQLILRNEDLDRARCRPEFVPAMLEDLRWFGFEWNEGPDVGGPFGPYNQSMRMNYYHAALETLRAKNFIYPCTCSRKDIRSAVSAPHGDDEPVYPGTCRGKSDAWRKTGGLSSGAASPVAPPASFRFRVPDGESVSFVDGNLGEQRFVAGKDFGDFIVWSCGGGNDNPSYQLACVVDDAAMRITEVVRGADLLVSTARQILLYRALGLIPPQFYHCDLMCDESGRRLAKRHDSLSLKTLRERGNSPAHLRINWRQEARVN